MKYDDYEEFFSSHGESRVALYFWGEHMDSVSVEELYRHFKARLLAEMNEKPEEA